MKRGFSSANGRIHEVFDVLLGLQEAFLVAGAIQLGAGSSYGLFLLRYWFPQVFAIQQT